MALWMAYALLLSLLLAAAARLGEEGLDLYECPLRWVWIVAMTGAVVGPVVAYALAMGGPVGAGSGMAAGSAAVGAGAGGTGASLPVPQVVGVVGDAGSGLAGRLRFLDPWLLGGWVAASLLTVGWLLAGWLRLRVRRRDWRRAEIDGQEVLISPDEGPAITGFLEGMILLPSWFDELDRDLRPLVLRHEREHLAVGDHRLLAGALLAVALVPWNPVLWWSLARLRQAMEIDCDRRVLGEGGVSRATYGELLVQVGERASGPPLSPAAFADASSFMERRIRRLAARSPRARVSKATAAAAAALALGAAGGWVPAPDGPVAVPDPGLPERAATAEGARPAGVAPPAPAVMRLDLRIYRTRGTGARGSDDGATPRGSKLDMEAVRLARQLGYACAPFLSGAPDAGGFGERAAGDASPAGCFVVLDGEPAHPSALRDIGSGSISSVHLLPADEAVDRFGPEAREGAYVIRTERG